MTLEKDDHSPPISFFCDLSFLSTFLMAKKAESCYLPTFYNYARMRISGATKRPFAKGWKFAAINFFSYEFEREIVGNFFFKGEEDFSHFSCEDPAGEIFQAVKQLNNCQVVIFAFRWPDERWWQDIAERNIEVYFFTEAIPVKEKLTALPALKWAFSLDKITANTLCPHPNTPRSNLVNIFPEKEEVLRVLEQIPSEPQVVLVIDSTNIEISAQQKLATPGRHLRIDWGAIADYLLGDNRCYIGMYFVSRRPRTEVRGFYHFLETALRFTVICPEQRLDPGDDWDDKVIKEKLEKWTKSAGTVILASGDGGFAETLTILQKKGKRIEVAALGAVAEKMKKFDQYIDLATIPEVMIREQIPLLKVSERKILLSITIEGPLTNSQLATPLVVRLSKILDSMFSVKEEETRKINIRNTSSGATIRFCAQGKIVAEETPKLMRNLMRILNQFFPEGRVYHQIIIGEERKEQEEQ